MTAPVECRYYGRDFTTAEMSLLRSLIAGAPAFNRHALSKEFCRRIGWYKADGGYKDMMARVVMLAMLGFSTAAWTLAPRDRFIGWSRRHREKNLPLVVDNPRFLILPWIRIPNLGSHILALVRRQLPADWTARYQTTPVLIETFVETPRYTGAVYRASGWTRVGATQGRGRDNMNNRSDKPKKDIWLRPLRKDWKRTLNR